MAEQALSPPFFQRFDPGPILDEASENGDVDMTTDETPSALIIGIDFGTTFSSVAWSCVRRQPGSNTCAGDIHCIDKYPDWRPPPDVSFGELGVTSRQDVPTELWYSGGRLARPRTQQRATLPHTSNDAEPDHMSDAESNSSRDSSRPSSDDSDTETERDDSADDQFSHLPLYWGFGVQKQLARVDIPKDDMRRFSRIKLVLGAKTEDTDTDSIRADFTRTLKALKKAHLLPRTATIKDVISDYLVQLFAHTQSQLQSSGVLNLDLDLELVLCVPALWPSKACRIMQAAMATAAERTGLGHLTNKSLSNLFIISEPEAAAACILEEDSNDVYPGETILILDAGGGTIDAVTYEVTSSYPLRLSAEVVAPSNKLCGASYINERFEKLLLRKLKNETYLVKNGKTIRSIVEEQVIRFENYQKRVFEITDKKCIIEPLYIDDLQPSTKKGLGQNRLDISRKDMTWVFKKSLDGAAAVLKEQLDLAKGNKCSVSKVLLTGGFGNSPSLRGHLEQVLSTEANFDGHHISLLAPRVPSTAVARGAVMRAFNKELGPRRMIQNSYGILRTMPYQPEICDAHKGTRCVIDKADGERYVDGTINWLIEKGKELETRQEFSVSVKQTFPLHRTRLICTETLYVSDDWHPSHYRKGHPKNEGAELIGNISVDMTFLLDEGRIEPIKPSEYSTFDARTAKDYWVVRFELVLIVDGRNLYFEARYPAKDDLDAMGQEERVLNQKQIPIAASFQPGTE